MRRCLLRSTPRPHSGFRLTSAACRWIAATLSEGHPALAHVEALEAAGVTLGRSRTTESNGSIFEAFAAIGIESKDHAQELCELARAVATPDATHPAMLGFVLPSGVTGHDDDGEKGAGRRIVEAATAASPPPAAPRTVGVAICVTRYYGGVMLGKKRWTMIRAAADDAVASAVAARRAE
jgi:hypothetical protein